MCFKRRKKKSNRCSPCASSSTKDTPKSLPGGSSHRTSKGSETKQSLKSSESENDSKKKRSGEKGSNRSRESLKSSEREDDSKKKRSGDEDINRSRESLKSSEREEDSKKKRSGEKDINRTRESLKSSEREEDSKKKRSGDKDSNRTRESLKSSESEDDRKKKRSRDEDINSIRESLKSSESEDDSKKKRSGDKDSNRSNQSSSVRDAKEKDSRKAGKKSNYQEDNRKGNEKANNYKVCWYRDSKGSVWKTVCRTCDKGVQADAKKCTYPCSDEGPNNQSAFFTNTNDRRQSSGSIRSVDTYDRRRSSGNIRSVGTDYRRRSIGNIRSVGTDNRRRCIGSCSSVTMDSGTYCWSRNTGSKFWSSICPTCDTNPPRGDCTYPCSSNPRQILPSAPQYSQMSMSRDRRPTNTEDSLKCYIPACPAANDSTVTASDSTGQSRRYKAESRMTTQVQQYSDSEDDSRLEEISNEKEVKEQEGWRRSSQDSTNMRSVRNSFTLGEGQFPPGGRKCPNPCSGDKRFLQSAASTNTNRYRVNNHSFGRGRSSGNIRSVDRTGSGSSCWYRDSHSGFWKTICSICDNDHQRAECNPPCSCNSHQIPPSTKPDDSQRSDRSHNDQISLSTDSDHP